MTRAAAAGIALLLRDSLILLFAAMVAMSTLHVYLNWAETWARWAPSNYSGEAREPRGAHSAVHYRDVDAIYTVSNQTTHARVYGLKFPPVARQYSGDCDGSTGSFGGLASKFDVYAVYWDSRHSKRYDDNVSLRLITHEYVPSAADDAHIYCAFNVETGYWLKELGRYLPTRHDTTDPMTVVSGAAQTRRDVCVAKPSSALRQRASFYRVALHSTVN